MPNAKNLQVLDLLKEKAAKAKSVVLMNYSGLTVKQQTTLRAAVREAGGELVVAKNTLVNIALDAPDVKDSLEGQTAVLFAYDDEVAPLKKLVEFVKQNEKPEIKKGLLQRKALSIQDVLELAKLPGKLELVAMVMNRIQGPAYGLVSVLNAGMRNLVYALSAIQKQKETSK